MKLSDPFEHYPAEWKHVESHATSPAIGMLGLKGHIGDINRFGARFRVAHAFKGVSLDGFSSATANGYNALFRLMLVWSAFELFMDLLDLKQKALNDLLRKHGQSELQKQVRAIDVNDLFFNFIHARVNEAHKKELANYLDDDPCNGTYLASSIRHIFVHGDLTPNAGGTEPDVTRQVCKVLSDAHVHVMNAEFSERVIQMMEALYS